MTRTCSAASTGSGKRGIPSRQAVAVQLATYRVAWAKVAGIRVASVRAAFYYVGHDKTVRPADLLDEAGLVELIERLPIEELSAHYVVDVLPLPPSWLVSGPFCPGCPTISQARPSCTQTQVCSDTSTACVPGSSAWKRCGTSAG